MTYICDKKFVMAVKQIYLKIDDNFQLEGIAADVGISLATLKRLFQTCVGISPGAFIRRLRLEKAFHDLTWILHKLPAAEQNIG